MGPHTPETRLWRGSVICQDESALRGETFAPCERDDVQPDGFSALARESNTPVCFRSIYQDLLLLSERACGLEAAGGQNPNAFWPPVRERAVFIMGCIEEELELEW